MTDQEEPKSTKKSIPNFKVVAQVEQAATPLPPASQEKRKFRDIHFQIASAMTGVPCGWPAFPTKLHRLVDPEGASIVYEESPDKIIRKIGDGRLNSLIATYWSKTLTSGERPIYLGSITAKDCDAIRRLWYAVSPTIDKAFPLLTWASDPRPTHKRMPFDPLPPGVDLAKDAPLFAEMMSRTTNAQALMAYIGSIFDELSYRQQYVWIYGGGLNGKGALIRSLTDTLDNVSASEEPPVGEAKHWTAGLMGKRLCVFADCNNTTFITSGRFKSLTGEDRVRVEPKFGSVLSVSLPLKFMVTSNDKPNISSSTADTRRIIYCFIAPTTAEVVGIEAYEEMIKAEIPAYFSACWHLYKEVTKGNPRRPIPVENKDEVMELASDSEQEYEAFVDGRINVISYPQDTPSNARAHIRPERMKELMILSGFKTEYERKKLRNYLERVHGVVCKKIKPTGANPFPAFINCSLFPAKDSDGS